MFDFDGHLVEEDDLKGLLGKDSDDSTETLFVEIRLESEKETTPATLSRVIRRIKQAADPSFDTILYVKTRRLRPSGHPSP